MLSVRARRSAVELACTCPGVIGALSRERATLLTVLLPRSAERPPIALLGCVRHLASSPSAISWPSVSARRLGHDLSNEEVTVSPEDQALIDHAVAAGK